MTIHNDTEDDILDLIFSATTFADYAENDTTAPHANIHVALATADPTDTGTMSTSEVTYTDYLRVNVSRGGGWAASSGGSVSPASAITFAIGSGGSGTVTHFSTGKTGGGATQVLWSGTVSPNIVTGNGITPQLTTATAITLA
jgi:hypothetical protein